MKVILAAVFALTVGQSAEAYNEFECETDRIDQLMAMYPVTGVEFELIPQQGPKSETSVRSTMTVQDTCIETRYEIYHEGPFRHFIDYFLDVTSANACNGKTAARTALHKLGHLQSGVHTVSMVGPDGQEYSLKFSIPKKQPSAPTLSSH